MQSAAHLLPCTPFSSYTTPYPFTIANTSEIFLHIISYDGCFMNKDVFFRIISSYETVSAFYVESFHGTNDFGRNNFSLNGSQFLFCTAVTLGHVSQLLTFLTLPRCCCCSPTSLAFTAFSAIGYLASVVWWHCLHQYL